MSKDSNSIQSNTYIQTHGGSVVQGSVTQGEGGTFIGRDAYYGYTTEQVRVLIAEIRRSDQPKAWNEHNPFVGLNSFREADAQFFFGREALVQTLLGRLGNTRFLCVAGPSGSGKSSLIRAGLIPSLRIGKLDGSDKWLIADLTPKHDPINQLSLAMARATKNPVAADYLNTYGVSNPLALHTQAETLLSSDPRERLIIFVDQFEELFTQIKDEEIREQFVVQLTKAATVAEGRVTVLLSLRADFVSQCAAYPYLREMMSREFQLVGAMTPDELVRAIALPVMEVGASIEPELVAQIVQDMKGEPGSLPLVQFALHDLFDATQKGSDVRLTLDSYLKRGGVDRALERHADRVLDERLPDDNQQRIARTIFTRVVEIGSGRADTRRIASFSELTKSGDDPQQVYTVVHTLADEKARLLTTSGIAAPTGGEDEQLSIHNQADTRTLTIAHERLIDAWPWLRRLIDDNREMIALQNQIAEDAKEWDNKGRNKDYLYTDARLTRTLEQSTFAGLELDKLSDDFLNAGRQQQLKIEKAERRRVRIRTALITVIVIFLPPTVFVVLNLWLFFQRSASDWPLTGFPNDSVLSIAVQEGKDRASNRICVGSADIGVGCSQDLVSWNIYQSGLPTTTNPAFLNNRLGPLGRLLGSTWSSTIGAVDAITFDEVDPERMAISLGSSKGIYTSDNGGVTWSPLVLSNSDGSMLTRGQRLAVHGELLLLLRQSDTTKLPKDELGSLYQSQDSGKNWMRIGGPGTETGILRDFRLEKDDKDNPLNILASGERGLYTRPVNVDTPWRLLLPIEEGNVGAFMAISSDVVYLSTYDQREDKGALYRYVADDPKRNGLWIEYRDAPLALVADPDSAAEYPVWILFHRGEVMAVNRSGQIESRGRRPGWFLWTPRTLGHFVRPGGEQAILMGHREGLLVYCRNDANSCFGVPQ